jgi:hypothetical protein
LKPFESTCRSARWLICALAAVLAGCAGKAQHEPPAGREIVLFDGHNTDHWQTINSDKCNWPIVDGALIATANDIVSRENFRDFALHLEYWLPKSPEGAERRKRSNSGVYLQGRYEIQILDSYGLSPITSQDTGSIYHQRPPDTQASRPSELWQTMDITYHAPKFNWAGFKQENARVTVVHNGTIVQNDQEIEGRTSGGWRESSDPGPIRLQYHTAPARFRNIRITPIGMQGPVMAAAEKSRPQPIVLFDGKDTKGWHLAGPGHFELKDGTLISHDGMGLFWHEKEFGDFILELDWKASAKKANSGIFVRFPDPGNDPWVAVNHGHEIQICDEEKWPTGSIYSFKQPTEIASKPPGEWNHYQIKLVGQHYTVTLNDKLVNEFDSPDRPLRGHIGIQNHPPLSVTFRNIRITELPSTTQPATRSAALSPARVKQSALDPGLVAEYFKNVTKLAAIGPTSRPFLVRIDKSINFHNTNGQFYKTKLATDFATRWTGFLKVDHPGRYTFSLKSDDDSRLSIGERAIIDNPKPESMKEKVGSVDLGVGIYPIEIEFHNDKGGAGCILSWQPPSADALQAVPESALRHQKSAESMIAWDKKAWDKAVWTRKAWAKQFGERFDKMDYGPFFSATIQVSENNVANKGIAIKLGNNDEATVCFDTELLRYAGGWTGGFLDNHGVVFDGTHGVNPGPDGEVIFQTPAVPGCALGGVDESQFKDPRAKPFGPLDRARGHYKGLYLHDQNVVLSYSVGGCDVLEMPGYSKIGQTPVFTRTFRLSPGDKPLTILLHEVPQDGRMIGCALPGGVTEQWPGHGRRYVTFPPRTQPTTYTIALFPLDTPDTADSRFRAFANKVSKLIDNTEDLDALTKGGPSHWRNWIQTKGELGKGDGPYVVDTLTAPEDNPYMSWLRFGGLDFFSDGRAALCTWSGDVWIVGGINDKLDTLTWKRFATGLFQPLGLRIRNDQLYVLGRDQITHLVDLNGDGEADLYENFNNDCQVSSSFHEFAFDLQSDSQGNFYFSKAGPVRPGGRGWQTITDHNGCLLKVSKDGSKFEVFATGLRAPNGMGIGPHDEITVADNQGTWTPACRLSLVHPGMFLGVTDLARKTPPPTDYERPICWLPYPEVDNSSGGQVWVTSDAWGPFKDRLLHLSYGQCSLFVVSYETTEGQIQGGVIKFPLQFQSGICRARFNPVDHQLYVAGLRGWQTSAARDCAFQRVRYTGKPVKMPSEFHVTKNGLTITFTTELDSQSATDPDNYSVEQWNLHWTSDYGSADYSVTDPKKKGRDPVEITQVELSHDHRTVHLVLDEIQPVMLMKIQMKLKAADGSPIDYTIANTINKVPGQAGIATAKPPSTARAATRAAAQAK